MREHKFYASMAIPFVLFLLSFFPFTNPDPGINEVNHTMISDAPTYLEVPDYIYSSEYLMIIEMTCMDLFGQGSVDHLNPENIIWLGYCGAEDDSGQCSAFAPNNNRCGDKIK